jgi:glycosyltransferase involved in cell wall biosynthesis
MAGSNARERLSLIVTVLDEACTVDDLLESITRQTVAPDEIVIVDGGSRDGTWQKLQTWKSRLPLQTERAHGASIARGRNIAIRASTGDLIAVTDAGVRLADDWLERLRDALGPGVDVVSGFFRANPCTTFERAMGATVLPSIDDVDPRAFLPSSRSVLFTRTCWERVGGYPEWLDYCEDVVFDLALKHAGFRFAFAPGAIAWFRPRASLGAFFRQYYLYARGDGKAGLWWRRHAIRYGAYLAALMLLWRRPKTAWPLCLLGGVVYTRRPYQRLDLRELSGAERTRAIMLVPAIRLVGDVAKMLGYPVGVWWRLRRAWTSRSSS